MLDGKPPGERKIIIKFEDNGRNVIKFGDKWQKSESRVRGKEPRFAQFEFYIPRY